MVRISVVQPKGVVGKEEQNAKKVLSYIDMAAEEDADIVCFPEGYPGPFWDRFVVGGAKKYSWMNEVSSKAEKNGIYIIAGGLEYIDDENYYDVMWLIGPDGKNRGKYIRTTPHPPYLFDENWRLGDDLPVFETDFGTIGILTCSEVYAPELSRILALKGAEIIFLPAGGFIAELMPTWKVVIRARAIENLA